MNILKQIRTYFTETARGLMFLTWLGALLVQFVGTMLSGLDSLGWVLHFGVVLVVYYPLFSAAKSLDKKAGLWSVSEKEEDNGE